MEVKVLQLHKKASIEYKYIQDKYSFSTTNKCIALSDGTTQSFKSDLWASMLVNYFADNPLFEIDLLKKEFKNLASKFNNTDFKFSSNFAKASLEKAKKNKGGTATFIGLQFIDNSTLKVLNCGDSSLFVLRNNKINSYPFKTVEELDKNNIFINTKELLNDEIENDFFYYNEINFLKDDIIILATDAVSRLILRKPESINSILKCKNIEDLKCFCETSWKNKELEDDDISIVIISPNSTKKFIEIIPPNGFCFPQIEEKLFIPSYEFQNFNNNIDNLEMEQLNLMIQQIFRETAFLKNKLKLTQALLISTLAMLILNTILLFFMYGKSPSVSTVETKNQVSTQYEENKPIKEVESVNTKANEELNNVRTVNEPKIENETVKKENIQSETKMPNTTKEKKDINTKVENVNTKPISEDDKKNNTIEVEPIKDSIKP